MELDRAETTVRYAAREQTQDAVRNLGFIAEKLPAFAAQILRENHRELEKMEAIFQNLHPENVLRRGYSITRKNGKAVLASTEIQPGDVLETQLSSGALQTEVLRVST